MIAVLASRLDPEARSLVEAWSGSGGALLSVEDLGSPGWRFRPNDPDGGMLVVNGRRVKVTDLRAVLTRRPAVLAEELTRIDPADRSYVAAETNAFLVAWLSAIRCPVVNRPTATSLCGPAWSELHWRVAAARAGVEWACNSSRGKSHAVMICGAECLWARTAEEAAAARALSKAACVELLEVRFRKGKVCRATVAPALADDEVRGRLLHHLIGAA